MQFSQLSTTINNAAQTAKFHLNNHQQVVTHAAVVGQQAQVAKEVVGQWGRRQFNRAKFIMRQVSMAVGAENDSDDEKDRADKNKRMLGFLTT
ncbi:hypothetical protein DdX_12058 [Ditylenchus destructor]|uniref:Uncharacterized protein n=1 Tax=Ditylenchus destructor TaxID=166010 RepID=A0AAD4MXT9_9BILA|nr:hypothetical protein DdX_12058 [Ditylenchus destructor]